MYGLMKARHCRVTAQQREARRLHYCGTCKTIGWMYGQRVRWLLNHDTVFLAEVLSLLAESETAWGTAYRSYNCLAHPAEESEMSLVLQYAATANVVLTEFKIADQLKDGGARKWRLAERVFSDSFERAADVLTQWHFPFAELRSLNRLQDEREAETATVSEAEERLWSLAEPTAIATALFFEHGARLIGRLALAEQMRELGQAFGRLVYLLDAFEDYEVDGKRGQFNALRAAFGWRTKWLTVEQSQQARGRIVALREQIDAGLCGLPISSQQAALFAERLRANLGGRIGQTLPVLNAAPQACRARRQSWHERWQQAVDAGKQLWQRELSDCSAAAWLKAPLGLLLIIPIAILLPEWAANLKSWRDCTSLGFNLMFWGALSGAAVGLVTAAMNEAEPRKKRKAEGQSSSECCCGCCCESCECCECCECCACDCGN
jgi:hypothetical protein